MRSQKTHHLMQSSPDGETSVMRYDQSEMDYIFTEQQRRDLAAGEVIIHHWSRTSCNFLIVDMEVLARKRLNG